MAGPSATPSEPDAGASAPPVVVLDPALPAAESVARRFLDPFPVVRIRGVAVRRGARVDLISVRAPVGARIAVRCAGRGCPRKVLRMTARGMNRLRPYERFLRRGLQLTIRVTQPGVIGKYTRVEIRATRAPLRTDRCLAPGSRAPVDCSAV